MSVILKVVVTVRIVVFTYVVFLYRKHLQFLSPPFANPACSWQSVTNACSIQNRKISSCSLVYIGTIHQTAPQLFQQHTYNQNFHLIPFIYELFPSIFYNTLIGKITCLSVTSAVHKFGRCLKFYHSCILYSYSFYR